MLESISLKNILNIFCYKQILGYSFSISSFLLNYGENKGDSGFLDVFSMLLFNQSRNLIIALTGPIFSV
ncbi:hypothetical protein CHU00_10175 [Sphingobacterium cellulitidis]|nr:hypothetical protein CHU00_10175 [Sphingobacterium cellulitidis]